MIQKYKVDGAWIDGPFVTLGLKAEMVLYADYVQEVQKLVALLRGEGIALDAIYFCPHTPEARCACRKPAPGLLEEALADRRLDLRRSFVAGDKGSDLRLARRAGLKGYLVMTGAGRAAAAAEKHAAFRDLLALARAVPDLKDKELK